MVEQTNSVEVETQGNQETQTADIDYKALYESEKAKNVNLDKYNKDIKAKYQAKISAEDKLKEEQEEAARKYEEIIKENRTYKATAKLSSFINDDKLLKEAVSLYADGDMDGCLEKIAKHWKSRELEYNNKIKEASMQNTPTPPASTATATKSWRDYSMEDLNKLKETNPTEYYKILNSIK